MSHKTLVAKQSLDLSNEDFRALLDKSANLVLNQFDDLDHKKAYHDYPQSVVQSWFDEELPEEGMDHFELLERVREKVIKEISFLTHILILYMPLSSKNMV